MQASAIKNQLIQVYTKQNLNDITVKLIQFNNSKNTNALKTIAQIVNDFKSFNIEKTAIFFSKLIMLYHPDKLQEYQQVILSSTTNQALQERGLFTATF